MNEFELISVKIPYDMKIKIKKRKKQYIGNELGQGNNTINCTLRKLKLVEL